MEKVIKKELAETIDELNKNDNADKTSAGFIYQDLVFIKKLLNLKDDGTIIGHEVYDDIHVIKENDLELIQVKHSINDDNLTDRSSDFWKTISKWSEIILSNSSDSLKFIFYTNKDLSKTSNKLLNELCKKEKDYSSIEALIDNLYKNIEKKEQSKQKGASENPIFKYVDKINKLSTKNKKRLFGKLSLITSENQIVLDIKKGIEFFGIKEGDVDNIYEQLLGIITQRRYDLAKESKNFIVDFKYFREDLNFDRLLKIGRFDPLKFDKYYSFKNKYDEDYSKEIFYLQLEDIEISDEDIVDYANERARSSAFFSEELNLLPTEEYTINQKIQEEWEIVYDEIYEDNIIDENHHKIKARKCLNETKKQPINFESMVLPKKLVKGRIIDLSNLPIVGWRKNWKEKYVE